MRAVGWQGGSTYSEAPGTYGVRIAPADRDKHFQKEWSTVRVAVEYEGETCFVAHVRIAPSFWRKCSELRSSEIGQWMLDRELAPWRVGEPPVFELVPMGDAHFILRDP